MGKKPRIPFKSGDEYDALTGAKRFQHWRAGERASIKRKYWHRFRRMLRKALYKEEEPS